VTPADIWTDQAATWPVQVVARETSEPRRLASYDPATRTSFYADHDKLTQLHLVCARCDTLPSVFCLSPGTGPSYRVTTADLLAGILSHIRRSHPDVVTS
jgi:hypothetical protein